jgi:glucose-6-phosphate isomerase
VGLFPLAYAGIAIDQLLAGAADMDERLTVSPLLQNPALLYAALQFLGYTKRHQALSVLMPYAGGLRGLAMWYRQLWAESLGKAADVKGQTIHAGPTPIAAVGATDQHSQVQLYMEGPFDKMVTFVAVAEMDRSVLLPSQLESMPELAYLQGAELSDILLTEQQSTAVALAHNQRPNATLTLPRLNEYILGQLLYFFEVACAYSGSLYGINTYDQPGVELGKQLMYAQLGKAGYQQTLEPFEALLRPAQRRLA